MKYIVAHNRDRDFYQIAGSLAEANQLGCLVTDHYANGPRSLPISRLSNRYSPLVPRELTRGIPSAVFVQALQSSLKRPAWDVLYLVDRMIGREARRIARRMPGVGLFLYSGYAREAFMDPDLEDRERNLFLFHPHPAMVEKILAPDVERFGIGQAGLAEETGRIRRRAVLENELLRADRVFCASALSRRSAIAVGVDPARTHVVPYGTGNAFSPCNTVRSSSGLKYLFVGQAIHRKGLHHLLSAWRRVRPAGAELVIVASRNQDGILDDLPDHVTIKVDLSRNELQAEYCSAHVFILPALVEGFGLVLLEALSAGCYVIFSENTGLADIGVPAKIGTQITAGSVEAIGNAINEAAELYAGGAFDPDAIKKFAERFSAEDFRTRVREVLAGPVLPRESA